MPYSAPSLLVLAGIPALAAFVAALFVLGIAASARAQGAGRHTPLGAAALGALGIGGWAGLTLVAARSGALARFDARPPPLLLLLVVTLVGAVLLGGSRFGGWLARGLPLWALVGFQAFRLPLEVVLHQAALDGTMPIEMSFSGYNFDIVSGVTAVLVALALARSDGARFGPRLALLWNPLGLVLLGNIVVIAIAATPVFHAFGRGHLNVWIADPPFVLLPSILVMAALFGHVLVFRKLRQLRPPAALKAASLGSSAVPNTG